MEQNDISKKWIIKKYRLFKLFGKSLLLVVVCFAASESLKAQQTNLIQLLEEGKQNYPLLKAKEAEVKSTEQKIRSARSEYLPGLTLGHQYTYSTSNNVEGSFFPNEGTVISPSGGIREENIYKGAFGSYTSALLDWKVVNFGKVAANVNTARADNKRSEADYQNELFQYQIRLADIYLLSLISHHLTLAQEANLQRAEAFRNTIRSQVEAGLRPGVDSSLAHAEYVKAKLLLLESQKNERGYEYRLQELVGGKKDTIKADTMNFFQELPESVIVSPEDLVKSPSLRLYQTSIDFSKARSVAIKRSFYPSISLVGTGWARGAGISNKDHSYRTDFSSGVNYQVYNYLFGLALRWNLTSYVRIRNDFKSEQFQIERNKYFYQNQLLRQSRELSDAEMQFNVSLQQAQLAPVQLEAARGAFAQATARYESGLTDLPTYVQSLVTLNRAEADTYIAYSNAWRALLMKAAAAGDLSLFLNQVQ